MATYKIESVEGIGPVFEKKLNALGITDTGELLEALSTPAKRKAVATQSEIPEKTLLGFANMTDLMRIDGVGPQYSELLEAAGVDTVKELAQRSAANLAVKMEEINSGSKSISGRVPSEKELTRWIEEAKTLPRVVEY